MTKPLDHVRVGQQPSASGHNRLIDDVNSMAASGHIQGYRDSTGFHTRQTPVDFPIEVRLAYCRSDAPGTTWIEGYLDTDETGERITIECSIAGGGNLNTATPRLTNGLPMAVVEIGGTWYSLFPFQIVEDCECTDSPLGIAEGGTGATTAPAALENLGVGITDSPTFAGSTVGTGGNTTTTAVNGTLTQAGTAEANLGNTIVTGTARLGGAVNKTETDVNGNVTQSGTATASLGDTTVATQLESAKFKLTPIGGFAIKLTNTTGAVTVAGQLVKADPATDDAVILAAANELESIGVFLDSGVADDAEAWVVTSGIGDVAMEDNTAATRGNWVRSSVGEAGYADATNATVPQPINQTHFAEIGHCIESVAAGGGGTHILARCVLHFN